MGCVAVFSGPRCSMDGQCRSGATWNLRSDSRNSGRFGVTGVRSLLYSPGELSSPYPSSAAGRRAITHSALRELTMISKNRKRIVVSMWTSAVLSCVGCYNNPEITERPPGAVDIPIHAAGHGTVGPGTLPGGSTAGPQPPALRHAGTSDVEPTPGGARVVEGGLEHAGRPQPTLGQDTVVPHGAAPQTGNEPGIGERLKPPAEIHDLKTR